MIIKVKGQFVTGFELPKGVDEDIALQFMQDYVAPLLAQMHNNLQQFEKAVVELVIGTPTGLAMFLNLFRKKEFKQLPEELKLFMIIERYKEVFMKEIVATSLDILAQKSRANKESLIEVIK